MIPFSSLNFARLFVEGPQKELTTGSPHTAGDRGGRRNWQTGCEAKSGRDLRG